LNIQIKVNKKDLSELLNVTGKVIKINESLNKNNKQLSECLINIINISTKRINELTEENDNLKLLKNKPQSELINREQFC
jgi:hypothetical protein